MNVDKLIRKNLLIIKNEAAIKGLREVTLIKNKNPIRYKINSKAQQLFGIMKSNLSTFLTKMLKSLKMLLVRPSFEPQFNSQFGKIVHKLAQDSNLATATIIEKVTPDPQESKVSLSAAHISILEKEIRELSGKKDQIKKEHPMDLPEYVTSLQQEVGNFTIPANNEIVHEKFKGLKTKASVELEDGSLYQGQWSRDGLRWVGSNRQDGQGKVPVCRRSFLRRVLDRRGSGTHWTVHQAEQGLVRGNREKWEVPREGDHVQSERVQICGRVEGKPEARQRRRDFRGKGDLHGPIQGQLPPRRR